MRTPLRLRPWADYRDQKFGAYSDGRKPSRRTEFRLKQEFAAAIFKSGNFELVDEDRADGIIEARLARKSEQGGRGRPRAGGER